MRRPPDCWYAIAKPPISPVSVAMYIEGMRIWGNLAVPAERRGRRRSGGERRGVRRSGGERRGGRRSEGERHKTGGGGLRTGKVAIWH